MIKEFNATQKKYARRVLYGLCALYLLLALFFLFFFKRSTADESIADFFRRIGNLIPFQAIREQLQNWRSGKLTTFNIIWNLGGNFFAFTPMAMALPTLFRPLRKWWCTVLTVAGVVVVVEVVQLLTRRGMIDVDDLILNTLGAVIGYALICIPPFRRLLVRIGWWEP